MRVEATYHPFPATLGPDAIFVKPSREVSRLEGGPSLASPARTLRTPFHETPKQSLALLF